VWGSDDYIATVNEAGGVNGVMIETIAIDTRYDVARAISAYKRYRADPLVIHTASHQTPTTKALHAIFELDKMANSTPGEGENQGKLIGMTYTFTPAYQDLFAATIDWAISDWKAKGKPGVPKIGYIGWDNPYGREALKGGKEYGEKKGVTFLPPEFFPIGTPDHTPYLMRLKEANYIYMGTPDPAGPAVIRDAYRLGLTKTIQFIGDQWTFARPGLKLYPEVLEGIVVIGPFVRGKDAEATIAGELWEKYQKKPRAEMTELYGVGVYSGMILVEALRKTLEAVGYDALIKDRGLLWKEGLTKIKDFDLKGVSKTATLAETERRAVRWVKFYRVSKGDWVAITDWIPCPDAVALYKW